MKGRVILPLALAIIGVGLVLLVTNHEAGSTLGMANDDFASLVYLAALGSVIGAFVLPSRRHVGAMLGQMLIWLLIVLVLVAGYLYRGEIQDVGARLTAGLIPGRAVTRTGADGSAQVVVHRGRAGHFSVTASVNGASIPFLVDTGASMIALTYEDARTVGIDPQRLSFDRRIATANGTAMAAAVRIDEIVVGSIRRENLQATVSEPGALGISLLGMNFLDTLASFQMSRDELVLTE